MICSESIRREIERLRALPLPLLMHKALEAKLSHRGSRLSLCSIVNAKSGRCSEDCAFCAQSGRYPAAAPVYPLLDDEELVRAAEGAKRSGAGRFSLVTSGRGLTPREVDRAARAIQRIRQEVGIAVCGSFGILDRNALTILKDAGMSRYHHNLETSREFFPRICTTHTFEERVMTLRAAKEAGLSTCGGGIFGLGESEEDRISMALTLRELDVDSIPLNFLVPIPGTPLEKASPLGVAEALKGIALTRLIHPRAAVRLCGGREQLLADFLGAALLAGADAMMIGGYLTRQGRSVQEDLRLVSEVRALWSMLPGS